MNWALAFIGGYIFVRFLGDYLVDLHLAKGFSIDTFRQRQYKSLAFRSYHFCLIEFHNSSYVFGSFVGDEVDSQFEALFIDQILQGDSLVEGIAVVLGHRLLPCEVGSLMLNFHSAGELDLHFDIQDGEVILVTLSLDH